MVLVIDEDRLRNAVDKVLTDWTVVPEVKNKISKELVEELRKTRINTDGVTVKISLTF